MACGNNGGCGCNCGCHRRGLCPISLGIAFGLTFGLGVFLFSVWVMCYGMPPMMSAIVLPVVTWAGALAHAFWAFVKGFLMGFFIASFYDLVTRCCPGKCCKKSGASCNCSTNKPGNGK